VRSKQPSKETMQEWVTQGWTTLDVARETGASMSSVCRWQQEYNLKLARGNWGGSRRPPAEPQDMYVIRECPIPATSGPLGYWQSQGLWMVGE
jgi:hypothetical protein